MGGFDFDRQTFARSPGPEPRPRGPSAIPGTLILLVVLVAGGFAAYRLLKVSSGSRVAEDDPALQQIENRLDALEQRMDRIDRRRRSFLAKPPAAEAGQEGATGAVSRPPARPVSSSRFSVLRNSNRDRSALTISGSTAVDQAKPSPGRSAGNKDRVSSLAQVAPPSQQEWEATANRLGDVVGELATQRNEIDQTQESLGQLSERLRRSRSSTPFTLQKGAKPQRVGPVRLRLEGADVKHQRYTMRLFMGDHSIELKNRASHEAIQFYESGSGAPFELVVSQIHRDGVTGRISLPARTSGQ